MPSSNTACSEKKILASCTKSSSNTIHSWPFSMVSCALLLTTIHQTKPCTCSATSWLTLPETSANTSSPKTTRWTSFGICATKASFTVQLTRKAFFRRNLCKMQSWWISKIKWNTVQFFTRITSFAPHCHTLTSKFSTPTWSEFKQTKALDQAYQEGHLTLVGQVKSKVGLVLPSPVWWKLLSSRTLAKWLAFRQTSPTEPNDFGREKNQN